MAFRYINPGLVNLFDEVPIDTRQGFDMSLTYSRTSGGYFYCVGNNRPSLYMENSKEYWVSLYWYPQKSSASSTASLWLLGLSSTDTNKGVCIKRASTSATSNIMLSFHNGGNTIQYGSPVEFNFVLGKGYHLEI